MAEGFARSIRRYVQMIDQNLGRAEKTEVLTDEVQAMEKETESIRQAFRDLIKPLQGCLVPTATDPEKRLKKLPESIFSGSLFDSAQSLSENDVYATVFSRLGEAERSLAEASIQHTLNIEKDVIEPLNNVVDKEIPSITKLRKDLTKAALEMDAAKKTHATLQKQEQVPAGKLDAAKQNLVTAEAKVVRCRDLLLTELYQFYSREKKLCNLLLSILQLQVDHHRRSIDALDRQISQLTKDIEEKTVKPVYGCDLSEHLTNTTKEIATVIETCIKYITEKHGLDTEGLFRVSSSQGKLKKLKAAFDANIAEVVEGEDIDVHCLADALKHYLRELPDPLMTFDLYDEWSGTVKAQSSDSEKRQAIRDIVRKLPKANFDNLKYLVEFMAKVTQHSESNKMSAKNLAIVIAPNLLYPSKADQGGIEVAGNAVIVVEALISDADWFFADPIPEPVIPDAVPENEEADKKSSAEDGAGAGGGGEGGGGWVFSRIGNFIRASLAPFRRRHHRHRTHNEPSEIPESPVGQTS